MKKISLNNNKILIGSGSIVYYENPIGTEENSPIFSIGDDNKISIGKNNKITVSDTGINLKGSTINIGTVGSFTINEEVVGGQLSLTSYKFLLSAYNLQFTPHLLTIDNIIKREFKGSNQHSEITLGNYDSSITNGVTNIKDTTINLSGSTIAVSGTRVDLKGSVYLNGTILTPGGGGSVWSGYNNLTIFPTNGSVYISGSKLTFGVPNAPINYPYIEQIGSEDIKINNGNGKSITLSGNGIDINGSNSYINLSGSYINLNSSYINLSGSYISLNGSTINLNGGGSFNLNGYTGISVSGSAIYSYARTIELSGSFVDFNGSTINLTGSTINLNGGSINLHADETFGRIELTGKYINFDGKPNIVLNGYKGSQISANITIDGSNEQIFGFGKTIALSGVGDNNSIECDANEILLSGREGVALSGSTIIISGSVISFTHNGNKYEAYPDGSVLIFRRV